MYRLIDLIYPTLSKGRTRRKSYRAATLLELLLVVGAVSMILLGAISQINQYLAELKGHAAANQLALVAEAAQTYIKDNALDLSSKVPNAGDKYNVPIADIIASGDLPVDGLNQNPYGSDYQVWIRGIGNSGMQALVTTVGGDDPGRIIESKIALFSQKNTGIVVHDPYPNADDDKIVGAFGGWSAKVSDFRPGGGLTGQVWLATLLSVQSDITGSDYLYRGKIPGRPDLNQMRTDITMTTPADNVDASGNPQNTGIVWKDPSTGQNISLRLDKSDTTSETKLVINGDAATNGLLLNNPDSKTPIYLQVKNDTAPNAAPTASGFGSRNVSGPANNGGATLTINSTLAVNNTAASIDGYGANNPYNLFVDGKANITGDLQVGGDLYAKGDTHLGDSTTDTTTVGGTMNVNGPTTINNTLTVTDNAFFKKDVTIEGNLNITNCLAIGGATNDPTYCLNVGSGGRPNAAHFLDDVRVDGAVNTSGDITAENSNVRAEAYFYQSDKRWKKDISPLEDSLSKLKQIDGVSYTWKNTDRKDMGVIAQDVEKVFPELVHTDEKGFKSVEYGNFIAPIIESIKQISDENDQLKKDNQDLKTKVDQLNGQTGQ